MSLPQRIRDYLDSQNVPYQWLPHTQAFPAQEVAHALHVSGKHFAKAIVLHADRRLVMAVLAASRRLSLDELEDALEAKRVEMAPEDELAELCPDCELGAFPPFGNLYGMDVWIDRALGDSEEIVFNAGSHKDALRMKYSDYVKLTKPRVSSFSEVPAA
jgi:Ala-tRNA(Pro) deacylase